LAIRTIPRPTMPEDPAISHLVIINKPIRTHQFSYTLD